MKTITFLFILVLYGTISMKSFSSAHASNIANSKRLTGTILDADSRLPLANVSVAFYHSKDSTLVAGTISNSDGKFCIATPEPGNCYLVLSGAGYDQQIINLSSIDEFQNYIRLGDIYLTKQNQVNLSARRRSNN